MLFINHNMDSLSFYTAIEPGWLNGYIPSFALVGVQLVFMGVYREGGRRAVDVSWYSPRDKLAAAINTLLQVAMLLLSVFVPFKLATAWFYVGVGIYVVAVLGFVAAFYAYCRAPLGKAITGGIYKMSRNPQYACFTLGMVGVCVASASLWMALLLVPFAIATHLVVLGEERYCARAYGDGYAEYKRRVPRYFLFL